MISFKNLMQHYDKINNPEEKLIAFFQNYIGNGRKIYASMTIAQICGFDEKTTVDKKNAVLKKLRKRIKSQLKFESLKFFIPERTLAQIVMMIEKPEI